MGFSWILTRLQSAAWNDYDGLNWEEVHQSFIISYHLTALRGLDHMALYSKSRRAEPASHFPSGLITHAVSFLFHSISYRLECI